MKHNPKNNNKLVPTIKSAIGYLDTYTHGQRKKDCFELCEMMRNITECMPRLWGKDVIGFGQFKYNYLTGFKGIKPLVSFASRKSFISIYTLAPFAAQETYLEKLGRYKKNKSCIHINSLDEINKDQLELILKSYIKYQTKKYVQR